MTACDAAAVSMVHKTRIHTPAASSEEAQAGAKVAFAQSKEEGWEHANRLWPSAGLPGELAQILQMPEHFEQATELVTLDSTRESVVAGNVPRTT